MKRMKVKQAKKTVNVEMSDFLQLHFTDLSILERNLRRAFYHTSFSARVSLHGVELTETVKHWGNMSGEIPTITTDYYFIGF